MRDENYYLSLTLAILIDRIYTTVDRGRLVTSIKRDTTASEPIQTRWAPNVGGKTHLIQARPKDMSLPPFPHSSMMGGKTNSPRPNSM